jgi:hypothetical protein
MTLEQAKQTLAKYLVGDHVQPERLEEARRLVVDQDQEYVEYLKGEYRLAGGLQGGCDLFMDRVAEFSELSRDAQRAEMPELLLHLEDCSSCRKAYWDVRQPWEGPTLGQRLVEGIRLLVGRAGSLIQRGLGPPPVEVRFVAATNSAALDAAPTAAPAQREWELADDENDCTIRLVVIGISPDEVDVNCIFEGAAVEAGTLKPGILEVRRAPSGSLCHSAPFTKAAATPFSPQPGSWTVRLSLKPGSWAVRLKAKGPGGAVTWDLPLELDASAAGEAQ